MDILLTVFLSVLQLAHLVDSRQLEIVYNWRTLSFATPPGYPADPEYQPEYNFISGLEITSNKIFLATPRLSRGTPATLSFIPRSDVTAVDSPPPLQAYPSWEWHRPAVQRNITNCNTTLVSVFRMERDRCNRLWVLDAGVLDSAGDVSYPCRPKIVVFDLNTNAVVRLATFPENVIGSGSVMVNIALDEFNYLDARFGSCNHLFAYMRDTVDPAIVTYRSTNNQFVRVTHPSMRPNPRFENVTIENETFTINDGVFGLAVAGGGPGRSLFYSAVAETQTYGIPTMNLQGQSTNNPPRLFVFESFNKSSQSQEMPTDIDGSNVYNPFTFWTRLLTFYRQPINGVTDFKLDSINKGAIWLTTSELQKIYRGTIDPQEINIRLLKLLPE